MMMTPVYAAVIGLVFVALSFRTLLLRRRYDIAIGSGGNARLMRARRAHANFAEYVPLCLLLIFLLETQIGASLWVHVLCVALLGGRLVHAYGVSQVEEKFGFRVAGLVLTLSALISASSRLLHAHAVHPV